MSSAATIPAVEPFAHRNDAVRGHATCCGSIEPVLLVTPDPHDDHRIRLMLTDLGYTVLSAPDGERAVRLAERFQGFLSLLLTDLELPCMSGLTLADFIALRQPDIPTLLMFDRSVDVEAIESRRQRQTPWVRKPFDVDALICGVRSATQYGHTPQLRLIKGRARTASAPPEQRSRDRARVLRYSPRQRAALRVVGGSSV